MAILQILLNKIRMAGYFSITLFTCIIILFCTSKNTHSQINNYKFEQLSIEQGLSFNEVTCIMQDSRGFMWFGTGDGLHKYDGNNFTVYKTDPKDSFSISSNWINELYEDTHKNIWINAAAGLNRFDRLTGKFVRCLLGNWITSMYEDLSTNIIEGGMWFTSYGQGITEYRTNDYSFKQYRHNSKDKNSLSSDTSFCSFVDKKGILWIGTVNGLNSFDKFSQKFTHYFNGPKGNVYTVYEDPNDLRKLIWIGTDEGLYAYDKTENIFYNYKIKFVKVPWDNSVHTIYCDKKGRFWIGTLGGIAGFDRSARKFVSYQGGISVNTWGYVNKAWSICEDKSGKMWLISQWNPLKVYDEEKDQWVNVNVSSDHEVLFHTMCEDRSGTMWFGTVADAVLKIDKARKPFTIYTRIPGDINSLSSATVTGICEDAKGDLWIGTLFGLNKLDRESGRLTHYFHDDKDPQSLSNNLIGPLILDHNDKLWIGTSGGGLDELDAAKNHFIHHKNNPGDSLSLTNNDVNSLYESRDGNLWIGTGSTISEYNSAKGIFLKHFNKYPKTLDISDARAILEDSKGFIWVAVLGGGLNSYDRKRNIWTQYIYDRISRNNFRDESYASVRALCEDRHGTLWVGSIGLLRFDRTSLSLTPMSNDLVNAILEDGSGCLWLSTSKGLSKFNPHNGSFRNYDASDGVKIGQPRIPSGYKSRKGEMFFGGSNGFVRFNPDSIKDNTYIPPIVITSFKKFNMDVQLDSVISEKKLIELSYNENNISFEFAALNYTSSKKNQYAYKLIGLDKDWIYSGNRRYASYPFLEPGEYIFWVKGSNNDGIWNEAGTSISIIISPPYWKTVWAYLSYGILFLFVLYGLRRYELNRLSFKNKVRLNEVVLKEKEETDKMKSRFFANISHEFRTPLTLILGPAEKIISDTSDDIKKDANIIKKNSRRLLQLINQLLELSKLEAGKLKLETSKGNIVSFVKGVALSFESLSESKDITLKLLPEKEYIELYFDREKMMKILTNILSNAFKFTPEEGKITVAITTKPPFNSPFTRGGKEGGSVEIKIRDTGIGIAPEEISKLFDRFYQVDSSHTREYEGTGIGLALTKELVELHYGNVRVESEKVAGIGWTEFTLTFPLGRDHLKGEEILSTNEKPDESIIPIVDLSAANEEKFDGELQEDNSQKDDKTIILIVEDNYDMREYIKESLVQRTLLVDGDYLIEEAVNGEQGIRKAQKIIPDLIISDMMMPKMDGNELVRILKNDEKTSHIPIILLTAKAAQEDKLDGLETGADDYLTKPFDIKELQIRIKNLISIRKKLQEKYSKIDNLIPEEKGQKLSSIDEKFMSKVGEVIEKHISEEEFNIEEFCGEVAMSRTQLHRKIKALTGKSTSLYIRSVKLAKAKKMIENQIGNISEVAYSLGFSSPTYFTRCFKEEFGYPPSDIKK
jgi:signal transduction histidine kinase/ligand-binding sensor domain-containing protein/DNA-binding response OmpR family regulator